MIAGLEFPDRGRVSLLVRREFARVRPETAAGAGGPSGIGAAAMDNLLSVERQLPWLPAGRARRGPRSRHRGAGIADN